MISRDLPAVSLVALAIAWTQSASADSLNSSNIDTARLAQAVEARGLECQKELETRRKVFKKKCSDTFTEMSALAPHTDLSIACPASAMDTCTKCWSRHQKIKSLEKECNSATQ